MSGLYLTWLVDVLKAAGCQVKENGITEGWQTRARSSGGFPEVPLGVQWHHTASATSPENDLSYMIHGSDDAPVGNLLLDRTGTLWPVAAGAANTAGKGGPLTLSRGTIPLDSANTRSVAIEASNSGTGQVWPQAQVDAYFKASNAINARLGNLPSDVFTHALGAGDGWTDRKIDPATSSAVEGPWQPSSVNSSGTWSLADIRAECLLRLPQEDDEEMNTATLWRPRGYINTFLIGAGSTIHVSGALNESLTARGVPTIVEEPHQQLLETVLFQCGLTPDDLIPGGG